MKNKSWKLGEVATYPQDFGYSTICELPEVAAIAWVKEKFPERVKEADYWLNKLFIIVEINFNDTIALYNHDCKYYVIKMR